MKINWRLFFGFGILYVILAIVYWKLGGEAVGITAMGLSGGLAGLIGYYLWFAGKRTGGILPEDSDDAEIADGAGDLGFYSPHSW
ncbi:MAG: cytochrome c oxidase subunit 4, partial [Actinomycetes bacterium]